MEAAKLKKPKIKNVRKKAKRRPTMKHSKAQTAPQERAVHTQSPKLHEIIAAIAGNKAKGGLY